MSPAFLSARAADVVFVARTGPDRLEGQVVDASQFYGLSVRRVTVGASGDSSNIMKAIRESSVLAVIVSTDALSSLDRAAIYKALIRTDKSRIPLLIVTANSQNISTQLFEWTAGRIEGCRPIDSSVGGWKMTFVREPKIVHEVAGFSAKSASYPICGLMLSASSGRVLTEMRSDAEQAPTLVDSSIGRQPVFVATAMHPIDKLELSGADSLQVEFSNIAGLMIFLRNAAGDNAWQVPAHFANLTIDDPWLTEPYGNLSYESLLREMEQHNFHTTIAFVPWNFDRSKPGVVSLFQGYPDRFSICIHGNNHNHREFGDYANQPLSGQEKDIEQALARMERFKKLTTLPYDRVMVFPHAVAPASTLEILKKFGYWATVNSENVPLGSSTPRGPLFSLRPWTLAFGSFPAIKRVSAEAPLSTTNIAINAFLGNPQLFYVHQEYFENKIGAFDPIADEVNRLDPSVQWKSLGYIVRHLYLMRLRRDRDYEVSAISSNLELENPTDREVVFHVHRREDPKIQPRAVVVNGSLVSYKMASDELQFDVKLKPNESSGVEISYSSDIDLTSYDISKKALLVTLDRRLSDFRDQILSRSLVGRKIQSIYYDYGFDRVEKLIERMSGVILVICAVCILLRIAVARRKQLETLGR